MTFRIGYKILLFVVVNMVTAALLLFWATNRIHGYAVHQEHVDLMDESAGRGAAVELSMHRLEADVQRFSRLLAAPDAVEDVRRRMQKLLSEQNGYLRWLVFQVDSSGQPADEPIWEFTRPELLFSAAALSQEREFLAEATSRPQVPVLLSKAVETELVRDGRTERTAVLWAAAPVPGSDGQPQRFVVAALNLEDPLATTEDSARYMVFLTQGNERSLTHPLRHFNAIGPTLEDVPNLLLPPAGVKASVDPLRWTLAKYQEFADNSDPSEQVRYNGVNIEGYRFADAKPMHYRQSHSIPVPEGEAGWQMQKAINAVLEGIRESKTFHADEAQNGYGELARINSFTRDVQAIRVRAGSKSQVDALAQRITREVEQATGVEVVWGQSTPLTDFTVHVMKIPYTSVEGETFLGLVQAVSEQEIARSVSDALFSVVWGTILALVVFAVVAMLSSFAVTKPLGRITEAARRVGAADAHSEQWSDSVAEIRSLLPTGRSDEIGTLARAFEGMLAEIGLAQHELRAERNLLDERVRERTDELRLKRDELIERQRELEQINAELLKARDQAEIAKRATDQFVASVNHELRTPLNHVMGFCQLLELSDLDEQQRKDLGRIEAAGKYLLALVNDILDYQRIVIGKVDLQPEEFDGDALIEEIGKAMHFDAQKRGNTLLVRTEEEIGILYADRRRVKQVLLNLLNNACKFTENGTVSLTAARDTDAGKDIVRFTVADTGRGISPEEQQKLFQPFAKLRDRQANMEGTGLGLVISRGFCQQMGGDVSFESELGQGTTFTVCLPVRMPEDSAGSGMIVRSVDLDTSVLHGMPTEWSSEVPNEPSPPVHNGSRLVLVVDDDPNIRDLMRRFLEQRGFQIRTAANGEEGLKLAKQLRPAVITLDVVMPDMDGWETLAALKTNTNTAAIPVVMVTMMDNSRKGFALGVADFVMKPIDWDVLANTLRRFDRGNGRVLVVEDDPDNRAITRRMLEQDGWTVLEAENGQIGLERLAESVPDLIVLDLMMPVLDGFGFVEEVQKRDDWKAIPILVLTAKDPTVEDRTRLNGGVERILRKGDHAHEELLQFVHRQIELRTQRGSKG